MTAKFDFMQLGENVKKLKNDKGLTTKQLAKASELSEAVISRIESGSPKVLTENVFKIANALKVEVDTLLAPKNQFAETTSEPNNFS